MRQMMMRPVIAAFILIMAFHAGAAGAHGKESLEEDSCVRRIGENMVHLSAYQPQYDISAQYCTEIPKGGDTYLVVDLVDPAMREMPIGMRVIKGTSESEDETVSLVRPAYHPDGVIRGRDEPRPGTVHRHHYRGRPAAIELSVSLARTDDQLCQYIPHRGRAADRPAASGAAHIQTHEIRTYAALALPASAS